MNRLSKFLPLAALAGVLCVYALVPVTAEAAQRIDLSAEWADDGSCEDATAALSLTYEYEDEALEARGHVRQAPTAGDCRKRGLAYEVALTGGFHVGTFGPADWQGVAKFTAERFTFHDLYALEGSPIRPDGKAAEAVPLPAGAVEGIGVILGAAAELGILDVMAGWNVVPTTRADGEDVTTLHLAIGTELPAFSGSIELAADADVGSDLATGSARAVWRSAGAWGLNVGAYYDFGRRDLMADGAETLRFAGVAAHRIGPGADDALRMNIGITRAIN